MSSVKTLAGNPPGERTGVVIVDDHPVVLMGWRYVIDSTTRFRVLGAAETVDGALKQLRKTGSEILVTDIGLSGENGLDLVEQVCQTLPDVKSLVVSMYPENDYAVRAYQAGASGYISKDAALGDLIKALDRIADGGAYISRSLRPRIVDMLRKHNRGPSSLTSDGRSNSFKAAS